MAVKLLVAPVRRAAQLSRSRSPAFRNAPSGTTSCEPTSFSSPLTLTPELPATKLSDEITVVPGYEGPAYGLPDAATVAAIHLAARTEGMLTDPVYEGKSMAGLIGMIRSGEIAAGSRVLYCHLGGQPALPAYAGYPGLGAPERDLSH